MPSSRTAYRTCPLCEATCGLELQIEGERVTRVRGDAEDVFSRGFVCPKGTQLGALHHDPDRLRRPLVRRDGRHVEVEWPEAFEAVERGLAPLVERDRSSLAIYLGNPNAHNHANTFYARPLIKSLETRNVYSASTVDQMPKHVSAGLMFGDGLAIPVPDLDRCGYLLMLGANPLESNGSLCTAPDFPGRLRRLRERGGRLVVVDPRRTRTTALADEHVFIRPGSDALFLCGILNVLFEDGLANPGALAEHLAGMAEVEAAVAPFAPERSAAHTGIAAADLRRLARELAAASSAAVYGRIGTHTVRFGTVASWAVDALNALTGNLDRPGGAMFPLPAHARPRARAGGRGFTLGRWKSRVRQLPEVRGELPVATLADEIETPGEGQVRGLVCVGGNPVLSTPDAARLDRALASLDFVVSVDIYLNETSRHADVVLPPPSPLEKSHYDLGFTALSVRNVANWSPPVFQAPGPSEAEILARLALIAAGQGAVADPALVDDMLLGGLAAAAVQAVDSPVAGRDPQALLAELGDRPAHDRLLDLMLRLGAYGDGFGARPDGLSLAVLERQPHGVDLGPLAPRLPALLATPSGRVELAPAPILGDLEALAASLREAPVAPRNGLLLIGRRNLRSNNSWMHNLDALVRGRPRCTLQIHPDDARTRGLSDGDDARVASRAGALVAPVELCEDLMPGVVSLPHGWGHDRTGTRLGVAGSHAGVNSNVLTDARPLDPLSGNAVLNGIPVQVQRASAPAEA